MADETSLGNLVESLVGLLAGPGGEFTEEEVEELLQAIDGAAARAGAGERDAALRVLGAALHAEELDEVSEALLIAACSGPIAAGGDVTPVAEALVSFACVTLPVCCSYFLIMVAAAEEGESAAEAMHALAPLRERFPQVGFEITALQWTVAALQALIRRSPAAAAELRASIFIGPALFGLAPLLPAARELLRALDPSLAAARRLPPAPGEAPRSEGGGAGRPRPRGQRGRGGQRRG